MQSVTIAPDIGTRSLSKGANMHSVMRQTVPLDGNKRSRSNTAMSTHRPKSRASTTSIHSTTTTVENDQSQGSQQMVTSSMNGQSMYGPTHGGMMMHQGSFDQQQPGPQTHQMQGQQGYSMNQSMGSAHPHVMQQQNSFSFDGRSISQQSFGAPHGHDPFVMPQDYTTGVRHPDPMHVPYADFDGMENDSGLLDDSELADARKKRPSTSTQQNEIELKKLLDQYQGKSLRDVALEIQRTDNTGGKSEKVKQVFAMLWLQENCRKSTGSVRRDRVFSCYAKRCGNEAVPTLNPASFGKLVRIIFSDVKTRRLGVRGESKYHYVDLSLVPEAEHGVDDMNDDFSFRSTGDMNQLQMRRSQSHQKIVQAPNDSADFPQPTTSQPSYQPQLLQSPTDISKPEPPKAAGKMMECRYLGQPLISIQTAQMSQSIRDVLDRRLPKTSTGAPYLITYLEHPPQTPSLSNPDEQIELPDIHTYLQGETYDSSIADSLTNLYRSYCICLIDSFRYCKEKQFFHHHSAFNGNMTVPVQKLMSHERLAPWLEECDMRMYKRMIGFVVGLTTQVVPKAVLDTFGRICTKLVGHLIESFEKMPAHVVAAKIIPATRFVHLLSKLPKVNNLAQLTHAFLQNPGNRTQMWLDLLQMTDPQALIEESHFTPDAIPAAENLLRHEYKALLTPMDESLASEFENNNVVWTSFFADPSPPKEHTMTSIVDPAELVTAGHLDRWIQHLTNLRFHFPDHSPKCIINHYSSLWKAILTELGVNGASTYQCWWQLDIFLTAMMSWLTELAGFANPEAKDAQDRIELEKRKEDQQRSKAWEDYRKKKSEWDAFQERRNQENQTEGDSQQGTKRKREEGDSGHRPSQRSASISSANETRSATVSRPTTGITGFDGSGDDLDTSLKNSKTTHDDSGIGMDLSIEDADVDAIFNDAGHAINVSPGLKFGLKGKDSWGILSDPADPSGDVVVV